MLKTLRFLTTGAVAFTNAHFGSGTGPIYLDNVDCNGTESNLTSCEQSSYVSCYYGHSEDAGVRCQGTFFKILCILHNDVQVNLFLHICS